MRFLRRPADAGGGGAPRVDVNDDPAWSFRRGLGL